VRCGDGPERLRRGWAQQGLGGVMVAQVCAGVKACTAHGVLALGRCVPEDAGDELDRTEANVLALAVSVIEEGEADAGGAAVQATIATQRPAADVTRQVQRDPAPVGVGRVDLDVPVFAPLASDGLVPDGGRGLLRRQPQPLRQQRMLERRQQLAAEQLLQRLQGQRPAGAGAAPLALWVEPPGGQQAVQVRVAAQVATPGVQRHEQARHGAQQARFGAQREQAGAGAIEQRLGEPGAVELPQCEELVRQREHDVEVLARQQPLQLALQPLLARWLGAARAAAVAAGVRLQDGPVPGRALQHVRAQRRAVALADAPGRALLARMQAPTAGVGLEVLDKHLLQRDVHGHVLDLPGWPSVARMAPPRQPRAAQPVAAPQQPCQDGGDGAARHGRWVGRARCPWQEQQGVAGGVPPAITSTVLLPHRG
jgi:hypothetical protein